MATVNRALYLDIAQCMNEKGLPYSGTMKENRLPDDRDFGLWFEDNAEKFGFDNEPSKVQEAFDFDREEGGANWDEAEIACADLSKAKPAVQAFQPPQDELTDSLVPRIRTEALLAAQEDEAWQKAKETWGACLKTKGLAPSPGENDWVSVESKSFLDQEDLQSDEVVRLAVIEAKCNDETRLTQKLADLVAQYQLPLIRQNQAAINEFKELKQSRLAAAREYSATHG